MKLKRAILEMGTGNDLHGGDYTKAAIRAVKDALHHSSLDFITSLNLDKKQLIVVVTIGVQQPEKINTTKVKESLPVGNVSIEVSRGGLDIIDSDREDKLVIANAAVQVML